MTDTPMSTRWAARWTMAHLQELDCRHRADQIVPRLESGDDPWAYDYALGRIGALNVEAAVHAQAAGHYQAAMQDALAAERQTAGSRP